MPLTIKEILKNIPEKKIMVLGDIILDTYVSGNVTRISPEAPVPIINCETEYSVLGGAGNVAKNLCSLNCEPILISVVGDSKKAHIVRTILNNYQICNESLVVDKNRPTTTKTRMMVGTQQLLRLDNEITDDISPDIEDEIVAKILDVIDDISTVIISDYGKGVITNSLLKKVVPMFKEKGIPICVDPKEKHFDCYKGATVITPNENEASAAVGFEMKTDSDVEDATTNLQKRLDLDYCLITRGPKGMILGSDEELVRIPTRAIQVFDVTGAGDTVVAVLAASLAAGGEMRESAEIANYAAGLVVREIGCGTTTIADIEKEILK